MKVEKVEEGEEEEEDGGDFLYGDICFGAKAERVEEGDELYGDLYEEGGSLQMLKNSFHEADAQHDELKKQNAELENKLESLRKDNEALQQSKDVLVRNISCLFKTAQMELARKDKQMKELRDENARLKSQQSRGKGFPNMRANVAPPAPTTFGRINDQDNSKVRPDGIKAKGITPNLVPDEEKLLSAEKCDAGHVSLVVCRQSQNRSHDENCRDNTLGARARADDLDGIDRIPETRRQGQFEFAEESRPTSVQRDNRSQLDGNQWNVDDRKKHDWNKSTDNNVKLDQNLHSLDGGEKLKNSSRVRDIRNNSSSSSRDSRLDLDMRLKNRRELDDRHKVKSPSRHGGDVRYVGGDRKRQRSLSREREANFRHSERRERNFESSRQERVTDNHRTQRK